jgi:RimJ/RimL family protein N-acetyltransferase
MTGPRSPIATPSLRTARLSLDRLSVEDADEMAVVLRDASLHEFTGGEPLDAAATRARFARLAVGGSTDGHERWHNWVVRLAATAEAVGTLQATVTGRSAAIAWVIGVPWQRRGYATEAAIAVVDWLRAIGCPSIVAYIQDGHVASERVAASAGLTLTGARVDGERVWRRSVE